LSLSSWGDDRWADYKHVEFPMVMSLEFDDAGKVVSAGVYLDPARIAGQA
jgi:hypothetical protein